MPRILLIEDSHLVCQLLGEFLNHHGYETTLAHTAGDALRTLETTPIDLILLDVGLPQIDGLRLLQMIRVHPTFCRVPVIMLTANHDPATIIRARRLGALDYILKDNCLTDQLLTRIRNHVPNAA